MKITLADGFMEAEIQPQDLELEASCPACRLGKLPSGANCSTCEGRGIVATPLGLHILAFVIKQAPHYRSAMKKHAVK